MADRTIVDPSFSPYRFGFTEELQPAAEPVSTYVRPAEPQPSSLHGLAQALSGFSHDLAGFMSKRQAETDNRDKALGEAAAYENNGAAYADLVRQGKLATYNSPTFVQSYKNAQGAILGKRLAAGALDAYQTWPGRNDQDPGNFDSFIGGYIKQNLGSINDPDVLAGALPYVHSTADALYSANEKDRSEQLYQSSLNTHVASSSMSIDNAQDLALTHSTAINYDDLWSGLMADRQQALASGIRADDYDKSLMQMVQSKALEYLDPGMLGMLKNKVPGQTYSYADTLDGQKVMNDTLTTMEGRQAEIERLKAEQQSKADKAELNTITGNVVSQLAKNPNSPIDPALINRAVQLGDGAFAVHVKEWAKTLASQVPDPEDPASIMRLQQQILGGADLSTVTEEIGRDIHDPATLSRLYDLYNTVHSKSMEAVLQNPTVKRGLEYLRQSFTSTDLFQAGGDTPDGIQAQTDFTLSMAAWLQANPNAQYTDIATEATKVLKDMAPTISDQHKYTRPDAVTQDLGAGQQQGQQQPVAPPQLTEDATTQAIQQGINTAKQPAAPNPEADPWSGDKAPTLEQLPQDQRDKVSAWAAANGVDPQRIIDLTYQRMKSAQSSAPTTSAPEPPPPANEGQDAGDYQGDQSMNAQDANVAQFKPVVNLIGQTEGTDRGRGYDETIGYGRFDPKGTKPVTQMSLNEVLAFQRRLVSNGAPSGAVGRYQIINKTLKSLMSEMGLKGTDKFTPQLQDQMMMHLLNRRGLQQWLAGHLSDHAFMDNLAQEWASLPYHTGGSYYDGQRAGTSRSHLQGILNEIKSGGSITA